MSCCLVMVCLFGAKRSFLCQGRGVYVSGKGLQYDKSAFELIVMGCLDKGDCGDKGALKVKGHLTELKTLLALGDTMTPAPR